MRNIAVFVETFCAYGRALCDGIAAYARERRDWTLHLVAREDLLAPGHPFDGIIARILDDRLAGAVAESGIPAVDVYGRRGGDPDFLTVMPDHATLAQRAAQYFITRFYTNFAYCGFDSFTFSALRRDAFAAELARHGLNCDIYSPPGRAICRQAQGFFRREEADRIPDRAELAAWAKTLPKPIAVFCCNSLRAYQFFRVCRAADMDVPRDCAILAGDEDPVLCLFADPPISSIDPDPRAVGHTAAERLDAVMSEGRRRRAKRPAVTLVPPGGLAERMSTAFYPISPNWLSDVLAFIDANMYRPIQAAEVFEKAPVSHTVVERTFRKNFGVPVLRYITDKRLDIARKLLRETDMRVFEVAARTGFASTAYFCRTFKQRFARSPKSYRD